MKHREWKRKRKPINPLPLFPAPYPGESFYSILCRYHVRSGNINDWFTTNQLFGYNGSLESTLLSPYHLELTKYWVNPGSCISTDALVKHNTAFSLYALTADSYSISRMRDMLSGKMESTTYPIWVQARLIHPSGFLRYCPECAADQKKLYGEEYWQVLPQVDGVEYCPVHGTRIRNSHVPIKSIRHKFFPASAILRSTADFAKPVYEEMWTELFDKKRDLFIRLAQSINWLHKNGDNCKGERKLSLIYNKVLGREDGRYWPVIHKRELCEFFPAYNESGDFYRYFQSKVYSMIDDGTVFLYNISLCAHVMLMNAISGSPQLFYEKC